MEDVFCDMMKGMCRCINSSVDDANVSTIVQNMITSKKVPNHFDLNHTDDMESVIEIDNLKSELGDTQCNWKNLQRHKSYHKTRVDYKGSTAT